MKVSIITVAYNSEKTISNTIESLLNQSYNDIEYIVVDGKSSDKTINIIKSYESKFGSSEKQYLWISENDTGIYDAINKGIQMASGDVIGLLNSDDYFYDQDVIADVVNQFKEQDVDCLYGNIKYIHPESKRVVRRWVSRDFEHGLFEKSWTPGHPSFYCKRDVYNRLGLYRTDFKIAADVELMYRFLEINSIRSLYFDRYMVIMRQGGVSNNGLRSTVTITKEMRKAITENGGRFNLFKYLLFKGLKIKEYLVRH